MTIPNNNQKGQIALLLTLVFLFAILSIGIGLTYLTVKEITMARNIEESAIALAAADAGMEFALNKTGDDPPGKDQPLNEVGETWLCSRNHWVYLSESDSYYCLKYTGDSKDPSSITSIGANSDKSVRRTSYMEISPEERDQFAISPDFWQSTTNEPCDFPTSLKVYPVSNGGGQPNDYRVGQTFKSDTTGKLTRIRVWRDGLEYHPYEFKLKMELREGFFTGALLEESDEYYLRSCSGASCKCPERYDYCCPIDFIFSSPVSVTAGQVYAMVIRWVDFPFDPYYGVDIKFSGQEVYIPGYTRHYQTTLWHSLCPSDIAFEVYIFHEGQDFDEVRP